MAAIGTGAGANASKPAGPAAAAKPAPSALPTSPAGQLAQRGTDIDSAPPPNLPDSLKQHWQSDAALDAQHKALTDPAFVQQCQDIHFLQQHAPAIESYANGRIAQQAAEQAKQDPNFNAEQWAQQKMGEFQHNMEWQPGTWKTAIETAGKENGISDIQQIVPYFQNLWQKGAIDHDPGSILQLAGYGLGIGGIVMGLISTFTGGSAESIIGSLMAGALGVAAGTGVFNNMLGLGEKGPGQTQTQPNTGPGAVGTGGAPPEAPDAVPNAPAPQTGVQGGPGTAGAPTGPTGAPAGQPGLNGQGSIENDKSVLSTPGHSQQDIAAAGKDFINQAQRDPNALTSMPAGAPQTQRMIMAYAGADDKFKTQLGNIQWLLQSGRTSAAVMQTIMDSAKNKGEYVSQQQAKWLIDAVAGLGAQIAPQPPSAADIGSYITGGISKMFGGH